MLSATSERKGIRRYDDINRKFIPRADDPKRKAIIYWI